MLFLQPVGPGWASYTFPTVIFSVALMRCVTRVACLATSGFAEMLFVVVVDFACMGGFRYAALFDGVSHTVLSAAAWLALCNTTAVVLFTTYSCVPCVNGPPPPSEVACELNVFR